MRRLRMVSARGLFLVAGLVAAGCAPGRTPVVAGALPGGLDAFLAAHPLDGAQPLRADEVGRTAAASWHVVQVRGAETPHRHRLHDLAVFVLRGEGLLTLDGRPSRCERATPRSCRATACTGSPAAGPT